jgi:hypothetical protein
MAELELLQHLVNPLATTDQRRAAEAFVASDAAWRWCAAALSDDQHNSSQLQLLVAQIIRHKLNTSGWQLPPEQLLQLRDLLLRRLSAPPAPGGALLSELLLSLAAAFCLLPGWDGPVDTVIAAGLGELQVARFLQLLAEEAGGDLRRVQHGGSAGTTAQLEWVTGVKARLLTSCDRVAGVLLQLFVSCAAAFGGGSSGGGGGAGAVAVAQHALLCLAAWVRLGLLHEIAREPTAQMLHAALSALHSGDEQVLTAAVAVLEEVPEFAPEALLDDLEPSMLAVASAAAQAAAASAPAARGAPHAAAWCRVFAAFAAARPATLLAAAAAGRGGAALADALLQLALLPQVGRGAPVALPALEVWATVLDDDERAGDGGRGQQGGGADDREGSPANCFASVEAACSLLQYGLATNLLAWCSNPDVMESLGAGAAAEASPGGLPDQIWRAACRSLGAPKSLSAALSLAGLNAPARFHHPPGARRSIDQPLLTPPATPPASAARASPHGSFGGGEWDERPAWQQQLERAHEAARAAAPPALRLLWALNMAGAAAAVVAEAAAGADREEGLEQGPAGAGGEVAAEIGDLVMQLVMPAGQLLQAHLVRRQAGGAGAADGSVPEGLPAAFCRAVQVRELGLKSLRDARSSSVLGPSASAHASPLPIYLPILDRAGPPTSWRRPAAVRRPPRRAWRPFCTSSST